MTLISPSSTVRPTSLAEAHDAIADSADHTLLFRGGGTKLDWGGTPDRTDLVVDTTGLDRLVAHAAGDMTATVQAGMPVDRLQAELATAGQWLANDAPAGDATVGGLLAANDFGPRRLRYGAMRDNVIGVTVLLSDATVARSGGNVIKNVAGYDLAKLLCGSLGTLGMVVEVVLRLHPLAATSRTVTVTTDAREATDLTLRLLASPIEPSALDWVSTAGTSPEPGTLLVRLEGSEPGVEAQTRATSELAAGCGHDAGIIADDQEHWTALAAASAGDGTDTVAHTATLPGETADLHAALDEACAETGLTATLHSHTALGLHTARFHTPAGVEASSQQQAAAVTAWRRRLAPMGALAWLRSRPEGVDEHLDPWGLDKGHPLAANVPLMRAVKLRLDPAGRCAPGRQLGGI